MGVFAVAYPYTSAFLDVGRVDMLCLFLTMAALILTRRGHLVLAALVWASALQAKQGVLPIAVLALCCEWRSLRRLLVGLGSFLVFCALSVGVLSRLLGPWYAFYVFKVPPGFKVDLRVLEFFLPQEVMPVFAVSLLLIAAGALLTRPVSWLSRRSSFYILTGIGMVLYTGFVRAHAGAALNANIPACLWIALVVGVCFERLCRWIEPQASGNGECGLVAKAGLVLLLLAPLAQMIPNLNGPAFWVPKQADREAREAFLREVRAIPGDVLFLDHPQYAEAAGKAVYADGKAMDGLITSKSTGLGVELRDELATRVHARQFSAIVLDGSLESDMKDDRLPADFSSFYPIRGVIRENELPLPPTQPRWIFLPCPSESSPDPGVSLARVPLDSSACGASSGGR